jgi:hypothetical protein
LLLTVVFSSYAVAEEALPLSNLLEAGGDLKSVQRDGNLDFLYVVYKNRVWVCFSTSAVNGQEFLVSGYDPECKPYGIRSREE